MIVEKISRPQQSVVEAFRALLKHDSVTCAISDCLGRFGTMTADMRPLFDGIRIAGPAITVRTLASDLAAAFKAIDVATPGDIVVIDTRGSTSTAFWGENMSLSAINRGIAGAVIDGSCRDVVEIRQLRFPVVCRGIVPNVAAISGYGDVNVPIQCAGAAVAPGDLVVSDENGIVVVPRERCSEILEKTERLLATEHVLQDRIRAGATIGQLVDIDRVFASTFDYQDRAVDGKS
jgi:regulator of RNase E activity RraA